MWFNSAVKHKNDVSDNFMISFLEVVRMYSFMKKNKVYIRASYSVSLFVTTKNNFIKGKIHALRAFIGWWKPSTASWVFTNLLSNSPKCSPQFLPGYEERENVFYFLDKNEEKFLLFVLASANKPCQRASMEEYTGYCCQPWSEYKIWQSILLLCV